MDIYGQRISQEQKSRIITKSFSRTWTFGAKMQNSQTLFLRMPNWEKTIEFEDCAYGEYRSILHLHRHHHTSSCVCVLIVVGITCVMCCCACMRMCECVRTTTQTLHSYTQTNRRANMQTFGLRVADIGLDFCSQQFFYSLCELCWKANELLGNKHRILFKSINFVVYESCVR